MTGLLVFRPGPLSLLQDGGRRGWLHLGVSPAGAMDLHAAAWANRLLGNPWGAPLLEVALGGVELHSRVDTWLALCGAELSAQLDGEALPGWTRFAIRAGQRLHLGYARSGQRAYLAAAGGFHAASVLGSVSAQVREGLGGLDGQGSPLVEGDLLPCAAVELRGRCSVPWRFRPDYANPPPLRVVLGGDAEAFDEAQLRAFFTRSWRLSPQSDRMGARLQGEALQAPTRQWSLGVSRGTVQVPADGQPIVLQADHQSMGGYPILGWLAAQDQWRLAQCAAQQSLHFVPARLDEVQAQLRAFYRFFRR